jgi:hypothetical protein
MRARVGELRDRLAHVERANAVMAQHEALYRQEQARRCRRLGEE